MARVPMVTRTMTTTHATVLAVDINNAEVFNHTYDIPRTYKDDESVLAACRKQETRENVRLVSVVHTVVDSALYKMTEDAFMANAERCSIDDESEESTDESKESEVNE